ncbi:flagellar biosynthetic protein FliO [Roseateles violae]|uniref:Flagellar protein n=1 Tax=Roseateles violae TaxID=3058042 RepID=A0ABT8DP35_9BURK|nr:flagellar biosynthetic protein FliO [Pelomonas sp. PFR6]MDN3919763.1 flagellar biosynthetic protein FliO [Pelomonas sp. PFR6]
MNTSTSLLPLLWFLAILALIPLALWLLKRTPLGGASTGGQMRLIAQLPIAPNQRLVTVEVGQGDDRRWLVLGVTGSQINTLHVMPPQPESAGGVGQQSFAQMLGARLRGDQRAP